MNIRLMAAIAVFAMACTDGKTDTDTDEHTDDHSDAMDTETMDSCRAIMLGLLLDLKQAQNNHSILSLYLAGHLVSIVDHSK